MLVVAVAAVTVLLVRAVRAAVEQVLLVVLELDTAVAVAVLQMSQQHQTTLVELASKALSE
jgi:hypothetical protein